MRVVVERYYDDIVVRELDNSGYESRSHTRRTIMRIPDQTMGVSHFILTIPDDATVTTVRLIVCAFAAGLESAGADRGSDYDRVARISGPLDINLSPFYGCN